MLQIPQMELLLRLRLGVITASDEGILLPLPPTTRAQMPPSTSNSAV
jgi:hypothetical protein